MLERIALGGASGYLGGYLKREFGKAGMSVLSLPRELLSTESFHVWLATQKPQAIVFANGIVDRNDSVAWDALTQWCVRWVRAAEGTSVRILSWLGSAAQYGVTSSPEPRREEMPVPETLGAYGNSKVYQSETLFEACERVGLGALEARVFNLIGPDLPEHLLVGKMVRIVRKELPPFFRYSLESVRDYLDVREVARLIRELIFLKGESSEKVPNIVNIASGRGVSGREIWEAFVKLTRFTETVEGAKSSAERDFSIGSIERLTRLNLTTGLNLDKALLFALGEDSPA
jgi:NDP-hexose 4-ketoreductase